MKIDLTLLEYLVYLAASVLLTVWVGRTLFGNGRRFLAGCFEALRAQRFREFEVVLVDNGSRDDSVDWTAAQYPEVRVIALPENVGFAPAVNRGIRATCAPYVALLNNDTEADAEWLGEMVRALEADPERRAACAVKIER